MGRNDKNNEQDVKTPDQDLGAAGKSDAAVETEAAAKAEEVKADERIRTAQQRLADDEKTLGKKANHIKVMSRVNMVMRDGRELSIGKECLVHQTEHERMERDARGPFYDVIK